MKILNYNDHYETLGSEHCLGIVLASSWLVADICILDNPKLRLTAFCDDEYLGYSIAIWKFSHEVTIPQIGYFKRAIINLFRTIRP